MDTLRGLCQSPDCADEKIYLGGKLRMHGDTAPGQGINFGGLPKVVMCYWHLTDLGCRCCAASVTEARYVLSCCNGNKCNMTYFWAAICGQTA